MIKLLVKNRINALFGAVANRKRQGKMSNFTPQKRALSVIFTLAVVGLLAFYVVWMQIALADALIANGGAWLYFAIFTVASLTLSVVFGIFETKSELFECKDNELLLAMPIKPSDILASRIIIVLIYNYLTDAIIMIPAVIVYAIWSLDIVGILGGLLVFLLLPLLSTALGASVGFVVAKISKFFKNRAIVSFVIFALFFAAYMYGVTLLTEGMEEFLLEISYSIDSLTKEVAVLYHIGLIALLSPLHVAVFALVCIGAATVAFFLIARNYAKLVSTNKGAPRVKYTRKKLKSSGVVFAITKKELNRLTSSSTYMLNAGMGLILPIVMVVIALINGETLGVIKGIIPGGFVATVAAIFSSMTFMSACSLSLEGNAFWIIKSIPVSSRTVLVGKALPQVLLSVPVSIICSVVFAVMFGASALDYIAIIATPVLANVFFAFLGIIFNTLFPRFDYVSEAHVIKQSLSTLLTMLVQIVLSIALVPLAILFMDIGMPFDILSLTVILIYFVLAVASVLIALFPCARKLDKMNA